MTVIWKKTYVIFMYTSTYFVLLYIFKIISHCNMSYDTNKGSKFHPKMHSKRCIQLPSARHWSKTAPLGCTVFVGRGWGWGWGWVVVMRCRGWGLRLRNRGMGCWGVGVGVWGWVMELVVIAVTSWWARWRLKSLASRWVAQPLVQTQIKENIKVPRHWSLWGEFTGDRCTGNMGALRVALLGQCDERFLITPH